ncbi:MAG: hypothetical protein AAGI08_13085 [Bacteroidota bacterium]
MKYPRLVIRTHNSRKSARLLLPEGGSTPYPLSQAHRSIDAGEYEYVRNEYGGHIYARVIDQGPPEA